MAVLLKLSSILLTVITLQSLTSAEDLQEFIDYDQKDETDINYLRNVLDYLKMLSGRPKWSYPLDSNEGFEDEADSSGVEDVYDDDRQSRSYNMEEHFCQVSKKEHILTDPHNYEYRPSTLVEKECLPVIGHVDPNQKEVCYVRGRNCQTVIQEVAIFKRRRGAGNCWIPEVRNISNGCRCHFERQTLGRKHYG